MTTKQIVDELIYRAFRRARLQASDVTIDALIRCFADGQTLERRFQAEQEASRVRTKP